MSDSDYLDELVARGTLEDPAFAERVQAHYERRLIARELARERERQGLSQTLVAARMGTSQSAVARLEAGRGDVKLSTIERFASVLGKKLELRLTDTT